VRSVSILLDEGVASAEGARNLFLGGNIKSAAE